MRDTADVRASGGSVVTAPGTCTRLRPRTWALLAFASWLVTATAVWLFAGWVTFEYEICSPGDDREHQHGARSRPFPVPAGGECGEHAPADADAPPATGAALAGPPVLPGRRA